MKSDKRKKILSQKRAAKSHKMSNPGYKSLYARKKAFLHKFPGKMGIDFPERPWK